MQCVKTTLKMFLPDIILHICDQTRWHDCNHKHVAQQSFFRFICFQIHIYGLTCNVSRIHKKYFYMQRVKMAQGTLKICLNMQLVKTTRGGATTRGRFFLLPILDQRRASLICQFNDWKHKTFAHQDLRVRAKSARFRDRVISCVTLNAFSTFPSSVFSTLPILCKAPWTVLALHLEVIQNMSSLVVCLSHFTDFTKHNNRHCDPVV